MMYIQLFLSFFQISLFSFGGGYAALPLIQGQVVNVHHWLSMTEFTDLITISVCVVLLRKVKMNPIWVMVLAGVMKVFVAVAGKI